MTPQNTMRHTYQANQRGRIRPYLTALLLLGLSVAIGGQSGVGPPLPILQLLDNAGNPCAACTVDTFVTGTSTPLATYSDATLATPNANPVILDSAGRATIYLTPSLTYRMVLKTSGGSTLWTKDGIPGLNAADIDRLRLRTHTATLATDAFTATYSQYAIDTEGAAASDNLASISAGTGVSAGFLVVLTPANVARVVTVRSNFGGGNIRLGGDDYALDASGKSITLYYDGTNWIEQARAGGLSTLDIASCDGRMTLTTAVPVTTSDVTAATTIRFTPYAGNRCPTYSGTAWVMRTFAELSLSLGADAANLPYDLFVYDNAGTLALERTAWTNDTTRATALTTQDGVLVKSGATTRRYLGTYRTTGTVGQTEDSNQKRYVWNYYHRVPRPMRQIETTDSWNYTTATWRQANAATTNQLDVVVGVAEVPVLILVQHMATSTVAGTNFFTSIGQDSTTAFISGSVVGAGSGAGSVQSITASYQGFPPIGRHFYTWLEYSVAAGVTTWYGNNGGPTVYQSGISGSIDG